MKAHWGVGILFSLCLFLILYFSMPNPPFRAIITCNKSCNIFITISSFSVYIFFSLYLSDSEYSFVLNLFELCGTSFGFQWSYIHCWITLAEIVLPVYTEDMLYTQRCTLLCCPYITCQLCNWRGVIIGRLNCSSYVIMWTFPMDYCIKM